MGFRVIKDMVGTMEGFFCQYRSVLPFLVTDAQVPTDGRERRQFVDDHRSLPPRDPHHQSHRRGEEGDPQRLRPCRTHPPRGYVRSVTDARLTGG